MDFSEHPHRRYNPLVDEWVLLEEDEIAAAMRSAAREDHLVVEGAGALALAASLRRGGGGRHAIVLSGAGVGAQALRALFDEAS